ncbi:hypothetical protein D9615_007065 [Tricholomella constricta]|uniref:FAD-binding FR-type domain-containing protein n=1 Tax=Tricholomella constricta TaxID=117010 RepID=A0A8H5H7Z4_9AGAR|nr:hypothetical protein D9615_007065 [Tricholomella constricta]
MADTGTPPVIPTEFQQYNSYAEDPKWQIKFTIAWTSVLAFFALLAVPAIVRGRRKWLAEAFGVSEDWRGRYARLDDKETEVLDAVEKEKKSCCGRTHGTHEIHSPLESRRKSQIVLARLVSALGSVFYWSPPGIGLNAGQLVLIAGYAAAALACICTSAPLISNSNRAGFLALAQLPPIFLLASKNSLLSLLLPPFFAYTRLNPLHRWASRTMFIAAVIHGALWIRNHLEWNIKILGEQKETSGVAALGVLTVIVLSSLRPVRVWAWGFFYWVHFLAVPAFFITACYHTIYAAPWIIPPIAFYAFDLLMRACRFRIKDARLIRVDNQMTLIHIPDCDAGFRAGQHLRVRVFFGGRVFESHPLSIISAPATSSTTTCLRMGDVGAYFNDDNENGNGSGNGSGKGETPGILLGARAVGGWTRALNQYAERQEREQEQEQAADDGPSTSTLDNERLPAPVPVQVMFDGPYGGCSLELTEYERVLLIAGGSGATFAIGVLDELVAACLAAARTGTGTGAGEKGTTKTRKIHFVWCTRSFGSIRWFAPLLRAIARAASAPGSHISLRMTVFVTCMCAPEEVGIPGLEIRVGSRPEMGRLVGALAGLCEDEQGLALDDRLGGGGSSSGEEGEELCGCGCVEEALAAQVKEREDVEKEAGRVPEARFEGALGVCASGPEGLTREAANAVARYAGRGREVGLHTEVYAV